MIQELKFDTVNGMHVLETLPKNVDVGSYVFSFEVVISSVHLLYCSSLFHLVKTIFLFSSLHIFILLAAFVTCRLYFITQNIREPMCLVGEQECLFI